MPHSESNELTQAKKLIDECKYNEADQIIKIFEEKGGHALHDIVSCHLFKCELLFWQGLYEDVVKLAEQTYKESLGLGKNLLSVDILLIMANAQVWFFQSDKLHDIIKQGEELLNTLTQELPAEYKRREAYIAFLKGWFYVDIKDADQAIKQFELSISLRKELGAKQEIAFSLAGISWVFWSLKGNFDRALKYSERGMAIAEESGNKWAIGYCINNMAIVYSLKGELDRSIMLYERSLAIFNDLNNKNRVAFILNSLGETYRMRGKFDRALECIEQAMVLNRDLGALRSLAVNHVNLIQILSDMGDHERAQQYLHDFEQLSNQLKNKTFKLWYLYEKALLLKNSPRTHNWAKAEEIFRQILEEEDLSYELIINSLLSLCDLLLIELQITTEVEVLEEIKPLITQLLDLSEKSHSFWILGETYLLQAKLALISLDLEEAQRLLTQGQKITKKYGLSLLARKISNEHDELLKHLEMWEKLKESKAPLAERMELSRLNAQMERMVRKRVVSGPKLDAEKPVLLTIMSKEGNKLLSNPFTADVAIDSAYFGEFLTSCNTFCDKIFSETFDRVKFGQNTVLITTLNSFSICYMFQGQSYSARQKLIHFSEAVKKEPDIMKILQEACNKNIEIKVNEIASLEELISESFLSDPEQFQMPFKAYEGDGTFIFVSYSHTDRLQVYPIIDYLNRTSINIWYDEGIPVSEDWKNSVVDNLERCSAFLVFITPHIIDSEYVRKEISFALKKQKPFFSIYLKETQLPSKLEFELGDIQFMKKYLMPEPEFYNKLKKMLNSITIA